MTTALRTRLLLATDSRNTPLTAWTGAGRRSACCAHGYRPPATVVGRTGFNGEYQERDGLYLLGSYRGYNPVLRRFHNPDNLSPFGKGGLNTYAYCLGDPVNRVDPTGHVSWMNILMLGLGIYALSASLTAFVGAGMIGTTSMTGATKFALVTSTGASATNLAAVYVPEGKGRTALNIASLVLGIAGASVATSELFRIRAVRQAQRSAPRRLVSRFEASRPTYQQRHHEIFPNSGGQGRRLAHIELRTPRPPTTPANPPPSYAEVYPQFDPTFPPPDYGTAIRTGVASPKPPNTAETFV